MNILKLFYFFIFIFILSSCKKASDGNAPSELPPTSPEIPSTQLSITPSTKTLAINNTFVFSAAGGTAPYTYSIVSGGGSIDSVTGDYTAPAAADNVVVRVTDSVATSVTASITVFDTLTLSPNLVTMPINAVQNFTASGGLGALTFSIVSGGGSIDSVTGQFTAGITGRNC
jgi:hypothetical protein